MQISYVPKNGDKLSMTALLITAITDLNGVENEMLKLLQKNMVNEFGCHKSTFGFRFGCPHTLMVVVVSILLATVINTHCRMDAICSHARCRQ